MAQSTEQTKIIVKPYTMETYDVFRKKFHIPSKWLLDKNIVDLIKFNYGTDDLAKSLFDISNLFQSTIYKNADNNQMLHDYLHFLLIDMLTHNGIPFIEEKDLKQGTDFYQYLKCTPDLIIKGRILLDIYIGYEDMSRKYEKYKELKLLFDNIYIMNQRNINEICLKINLSKTDSDYVNTNFNIFRTEHTYWMSCLKLGKILRNEVPNYEPIVMSIEPDFEIKQNTFKEAILQKLENISSNDT